MSNDKLDFGNTNIGKLFSKIFFPTLMGMLSTMAFIFTDGIFVGRGIGPNGLAAINLVGPIMMLISGLGMMLGQGASVIAAIHLAKGNVKAARINITHTFMAGILMSMATGLICYCFPRQVLTLLGANGTLYESAYEYYIWFIPTCLLVMIESIGLFVIRLDGSPRYAMLSNIMPAIVNIILDYIFIFPCHLGLMGASLATDIGGAVSLVMVTYYMFFQSTTLKFHRLEASRDNIIVFLHNIGHTMKMGASSLVGEIAVAAMMLTGNLAFKYYIGTDGGSAYSIACYLFPLVYMLYNAVAISAQPIISYNYGKKSRHRIGKTMRFSIAISTAIGITTMLLFFFFAPQIAGIFINNSHAAGKLASSGLPYYATGFLFMAINISMVGYYQSIEQAAKATFITLLRGVIFLVASFIFMPLWFDKEGLWLAIPVAEMMTTTMIIIDMITTTKRQNIISGYEEHLPHSE